jgi:hypothetical protein
MRKRFLEIIFIYLSEKGRQWSRRWLYQAGCGPADVENYS